MGDLERGASGMRIHPSGKLSLTCKSAWRFAALAIAALPCGCALPGSDGQGVTSAWLAPFSSANKDSSQTPAQASIAAGSKLERKGKVKEAIAKYEEARRLDSAAPVAHRLALLYDRQGEVERARAEFEIALKAKPRDAQLLNDMGYFAFEHGNWSESEKLLRQSLDIDSNNERAWVTLGLVLGRQDRYGESYDALAKILSRDEARANQDAIAAKTDTPIKPPKIPHPVANLAAPSQPESGKVINLEAAPKSTGTSEEH
jgi:Tfp pilus assembly protein PilF